MACGVIWNAIVLRFGSSGQGWAARAEHNPATFYEVPNDVFIAFFKALDVVDVDVKSRHAVNPRDLI